MQRVAVIARLKPDTDERARALVEKGPPFDPEKLGFERHAVYMSDDQVVFVFEGALINALRRTLSSSGGGVREAFAAWEPLLDGMPHLAHETYFWERPAAGVWTGSWGE